MRWNTGGDFFPMIPEEIRSLPIDLLRSHKVTTDPAVTERGIAEYESGDQPVAHLPGRMGYTKYRQDQEMPVAWGQNAVALLGAFRHQLDVEKRAQTQIHRVPVQDVVNAGQADGRGRLPQPSSELAENLYAGYRPLARGAMPLDTVMGPGEVQTAVDAQVREQLGQDARARAMNEVELSRKAMLDMTDQTIDAPWFLRM